MEHKAMLSLLAKPQRLMAKTTLGAAQKTEPKSAFLNISR